jgi:hypothetical protein
MTALKIRLRNLHNSVDIVHTASFLHLWDWDTQVKLCEGTVRLLRERPGEHGLRTAGWECASERTPNAMAKGRVIWRHDRDSFRRMWEIIGSNTGTMWKVEVEVEVTALGRNKDGWDSVWRDDGTGVLRFHVERL